MNIDRSSRLHLRPRHVRTPAALATLTLLTQGCLGPGEMDAPGEDTRTAAITGANAQALDTRFPAVGNVWTGAANCTGTLIGPRTVLTAAHCFVNTGQAVRCNGQGLPMLAGGLGGASSVEFRMTRTGTTRNWNTEVTVYRADRVLLHPSSVVAGACTPGATTTEADLDGNHDMALLHLVVAAGQPEPSTVAAPLPVITDVSNTAASPYGVHVNVDPARAFAPGSDVTPWMVGLGTDDRGAAALWGELQRHAARTVFYPSAIVPLIHQKNPDPANGWVDHGDSGGPLLAQAGTSVPGLTRGSFYVLGDLYGYGGLGDGSQQYQTTFGRMGDTGWMNHGTFVEVGQWMTRTIFPETIYNSYAWVPVDRMNDQPVPGDAFVGGSEYGTSLPVCRTWYQGASMSGKVVAGACKYTWGGVERNAFAYETLRVTRGATWAGATNGSVPAVSGYEPVVAGAEAGRSIYVCRGSYMGNLHPGKLTGYACRIGWGGREIDLTAYAVLLARLP